MNVTNVSSRGFFERSLDVYGRTGHPCKRCGTSIVREKIGGRSSHFCPVCQRKR
ncbi:zinc finger domain-containing protein [Brevibacterium picturae]|uniref:zinc finger domain-containing protein n=1 Tax=Brevibacterium picturae TaxID=260553 RepID=UPI0031F84EA6